MDKPKKLALPPWMLKRLRKRAEAKGVPFHHPTKGDLERGMRRFFEVFPEFTIPSTAQELAADIANLTKEQIEEHARKAGVTPEDILTLLQKRPGGKI